MPLTDLLIDVLDEGAEGCDAGTETDQQQIRFLVLGYRKWQAEGSGDKKLIARFTVAQKVGVDSRVLFAAVVIDIVAAPYD